MAALDQVQITKLAKRYGTERALAGVTMQLTAGSMCAVLGHNGAGKSTLLGIISTLVRPSSGTVVYRAAGRDIEGTDVRREIGLLAHSSLCYAELTANENLALVAGLYDVDGSPAVLTAILDRVGLDAKARDRPARTYSRGMVQRLALARALLTRPSLLLLDEPFTGLDRDGALALGAELGELRTSGVMVVVVTHDLEAIATRADHLVVLRRGQLVHEDRWQGSGDRSGYSYDQLKDIYHRHAN
ncbi:MAG: ATP-binding cassette domain-containing protein [Kofleriaceae bacterium]